MSYFFLCNKEVNDRVKELDQKISETSCSEEDTMHSLSEAVADGMLSDYAAFCGLTSEDIAQLALVHPKARMLVRLRSAFGNGRTVMKACEIDQWRKMQLPIRVYETLWSYADIRDIMAVTLST